MCSEQHSCYSVTPTQPSALCRVVRWKYKTQVLKKQGKTGIPSPPPPSTLLRGEKEVDLGRGEGKRGQEGDAGREDEGGEKKY